MDMHVTPSSPGLESRIALPWPDEIPLGEPEPDRDETTPRERFAIVLAVAGVIGLALMALVSMP